MEPALNEVRLLELVKAWKIREPLGDGEHPRSAAFLLEYKNVGSSFIARPVDSIPEFDSFEDTAAEPIQLDEEESSSESDFAGAVSNLGGGSFDSSSSSDREEVSEARRSSSTSSSSSEDMVPPRKNLIRDDDDEDHVLLAQRSKKQKATFGAVATGSRSSAQEQERRRKEEELVREREEKGRREEEGGRGEEVEERKKRESEKEEEKRRAEARTKAGQALVPVSALPEGASVEISPQLAPALLERAVLPADRQRAVGSEHLALQASQRLALVRFLFLLRFSDFPHFPPSNIFSFSQFVTDFAVLYRSRDELVKKNSELEQENSALKLKGKELEASFKAVDSARISSDLVSCYCEQGEGCGDHGSKGAEAGLRPSLLEQTCCAGGEKGADWKS